jgi:hypothetical protein
VSTYLASLPSDAIISERGLAEAFNRHVVSVRRAVARGELPPPVPLFGQRVWTVEALRAYLGVRQAEAAAAAEMVARKVAELRP